MDLFSVSNEDSSDLVQRQEKKPVVYSITEITRLIKTNLEDSFPAITISGEISNLTRASSGHVYFTLKDAGAQIKAVIWKSSSASQSDALKDGKKVIARGNIAVYEKGGYYQITVQKIQQEGVGALQEAFEKLKQKLYAEGLFDTSHKKSIPKYIQRVGIITSPTGAAIRDILSVARRRMPWIELILYPVKVQGEGAAEEIAHAIREFEKYGAVDVLIVGRGGGSLEDLWAFNEEATARAIYACSIPTISAVGHEIDISISDYVADYRAATPSAAAEMVTVDQEDMRSYIVNLQYTLSQNVKKRISDYQKQLHNLKNRYAFRQPENLVGQYRQQVDDFEKTMMRVLRHKLIVSGQTITALARQLQTLNPKNTLQRGYAIVRQKDQIVMRVSKWDDTKPTELEFFDGKKNI